MGMDPSRRNGQRFASAIQSAQVVAPKALHALGLPTPSKAEAGGAGCARPHAPAAAVDREAEAKLVGLKAGAAAKALHGLQLQERARCR